MRAISLTPPRLLSLGYVGVIITGTLLLRLPMATTTGVRTDLLTALFTATSATCVTGLIVENTGTYWSFFGQLVIMILIKVGGLGFMTAASIFFLLLGRRIHLHPRLVLREEYNQNQLAGMVELIRYVLLFTSTAEIIGGLLFMVRLLPEMASTRAIFFSLFHAVSAFNNAGFDLFGDSLEGFVADPYVNLIITSLFVTAGLGFTVLMDLLRARRRRRISLHSRLVLYTSLVLSLLLFLPILLLEHSNPESIGQLSTSGKVLASFFQSLTPRTAGFHTIPIHSMHPASILLIMVAMFIGASPASTGGGVKTTTIAALFFSVSAHLKGEREVGLFYHRLPGWVVERAVSILLISLMIVMGMTLFLLITEDLPFLSLLFEVISAFGTVGLSLGATPQLSSLGRLGIIITMFIGRLGPLTIAYLLGTRRGPRGLRYPEEAILVG